MAFNLDPPPTQLYPDEHPALAGGAARDKYRKVRPKSSGELFQKPSQQRAPSGQPQSMNGGGASCPTCPVCPTAPQQQAGVGAGFPNGAGYGAPSTQAPSNGPTPVAFIPINPNLPGQEPSQAPEAAQQPVVNTPATITPPGAGFISALAAAAAQEGSTSSCTSSCASQNDAYRTYLRSRRSNSRF